MGLLTGLGKGLQDAADVYGEYRREKSRADEAAEKAQALRKKNLERIVGYTEGGQPVTQGGLLTHTGPVYGKPSRPKDPELVQVTREDGTKVYIPKEEGAVSYPEKKDPELVKVVGKDGVERYVVKEPGVKSYPDQDDKKPSSSAINRVDKRTSEILDQESYIVGEYVKGEDPPSQEKINKINQVREGENMSPVRLDDQSETKSLWGVDLLRPDVQKWGLVRIGSADGKPEKQGKGTPGKKHTNSIGFYDGKGKGEDPDSSGSSVKPQSGKRPDGTKKGQGYLGTIQNPDGSVSTELSIGVNLDGEETLIPLLVPTLTKEEISTIQKTKDPKNLPDSIVFKAIAHARERKKNGESPFAQAEEKTGSQGQEKLSGKPDGQNKPTITTNMELRRKEAREILNKGKNSSKKEVDTEKFGKVQVVGQTKEGYAIGRTADGTIIFNNGRYWRTANEDTPGILEQIKFLKQRNRI